ncbi:MAG: hypothetical protein C0582_01600 [Alphaproteobacteria bacterium]|nr:MAG: hypothetical protein C0582_01600 [Alphaproteobacteria bacterium]
MQLIGGERGSIKLRSLVIQQSKGRFKGWHIIELPDWASDIVPKGYRGLVVPLWDDSMGAKWDHYDWWRAAHYMMTSEWERFHEKKNGPVHSYSYHYDIEDQRIFDHAWVNRIILFLRRWGAIKNEADELSTFGPIPKPIIHLTHDVDAISKTLPIRIKQAAFWIYNRYPLRAINFFFSPANLLAIWKHYENRAFIWSYQYMEYIWRERGMVTITQRDFIRSILFRYVKNPYQSIESFV